MPRAAGQIDLQKNEAILNAAATVLSERGISAPIERIARVAGVSKQTIYNHYGSKAELLRALILRRSEDMTVSLDAAATRADLEERLAAFAERLLNPIMSPDAVSLVRILIASGQETADMAKQVYEVGPHMTFERVVGFLKSAHDARLLDIPDAQDAAEFFLGMVVGHRQIRLLMGVPQRQGPEAISAIAREAAHRFAVAYAPAP